jgi:hypothetical protein
VVRVGHLRDTLVRIRPCVDALDHDDRRGQRAVTMEEHVRTPIIVRDSNPHAVLAAFAREAAQGRPQECERDARKWEPASRQDGGECDSGGHHVQGGRAVGAAEH